MLLFGMQFFNSYVSLFSFNREGPSGQADFQALITIHRPATEVSFNDYKYREIKSKHRCATLRLITIG